MDSSSTGSSVHGILWATILEWGAISFSKGNAIWSNLCTIFVQTRVDIYRHEMLSLHNQGMMVKKHRKGERQRIFKMPQVGSHSQFNSVQSLSRVRLFATPWTAAHQAFLSFTNSRNHSNSCLLSRWCHPTISSSVVPFSSCPQSLPASGSFQISHLFPSGGQRIGVSASASDLPMNI